jgi:hypothetical protein
MKNTLSGEQFNFISPENKDFILAFDNEISKIGYSSGNTIGDGYCWGKYMVVYSKVGVKSKQVVARIYISEKSILLRLFFSKIDKHREYIENAQDFIKEVFTGEHAKCNHCRDGKEDICKFRKTYTLENNFIEKCSGVTFEFKEPNSEKLPHYINLLKEFYPQRKNNNSKSA